MVATLATMSVRSVNPAAGEALFTARHSRKAHAGPILPVTQQETTMELGLYTFGDAQTLTLDAAALLLP